VPSAKPPDVDAAAKETEPARRITEQRPTDSPEAVEHLEFLRRQFDDRRRRLEPEAVGREPAERAEAPETTTTDVTATLVSSILASEQANDRDALQERLLCIALAEITGRRGPPQNLARLPARVGHLSIPWFVPPLLSFAVGALATLLAMRLVLVW
jgi:hypothetical protein